MGKQSRRPSRRNRPGRQKVSVQQSPAGLRLVVATSPESASDGQFLEHDLQLVRSALLYADTVELVSPIANMIGGAAALHAGGSEAWIELFRSLDDDVLRHTGVDNPAEVRDLLTKYQTLAALPRAQRRSVLGRHETDMRALQDDLREKLNSPDGPQETLRRMLERAGVPELEEALETGALEMNWEALGLGDPDGMIDQYADYLKQILSSPDNHLLLDESIAGIARAMIAEGHVDPPGLTLSRAARSQVGTGLVASLPAFPHATVSSVLEARESLSGPLAAYRGGVRQVTEKVRSGPFDPSMRGEVEDLWRDTVRPAVDNLRSDLSTTRLARETAVNVGMDVKTLLGGGGIYFGVQTMTSIGEFAAAGIAAAPVLSKAVASAVKESTGRREAARRHEFFYLVELDKRL